MARLSLMLILIAFGSVNLKAQSKQFECNSVISEECDFKALTMKPSIYVTPKPAVLITKFLSGGEKDLIIYVDSVVQKEFDLQGECNWYYGSSKDGRKNIFIEPIKTEKLKRVYLFDFADELTIFKYIFFYD